MDEEGEEEEEERNYFAGSTQNNKNMSVNTALEVADTTSQLNPDAAGFVPVSPSRFMMDPDSVISVSYTHLDVYKRQLLHCNALFSHF